MSVSASRFDEVFHSLVDAAQRTPFKLEVGDPDLIGWTITFAYFLACAACGMNAKRIYSGTDRGSRPRSLLFWLSTSMLMLLLALNKQLDIQTWVTDVIRSAAHQEGWYEERRIYQRRFILGTVLVVTTAVSLGCYWLRNDWKECAFALIGLGLLSMFLMIRASSFHHVDHGLGEMIAGVKLRYAMELGGVLLVAASAVGNCLRPQASVTYRNTTIGANT